MRTQRLLKILLAAVAAGFLASNAGAQQTPQAPQARQSPQVTMTVDATKTGAPISPYMYGFFTELHETNNEGGFWAEMLGDRKFFNPVNSGKDREPTPGRRSKAQGAQMQARGPGRVRRDGPAEGLRG